MGTLAGRVTIGCLRAQTALEPGSHQEHGLGPSSLTPTLSVLHTLTAYQIFQPGPSALYLLAQVAEFYAAVQPDLASAASYLPAVSTAS